MGGCEGIIADQIGALVSEIPVLAARSGGGCSAGIPHRQHAVDWRLLGSLLGHQRAGYPSEALINSGFEGDDAGWTLYSTGIGHKAHDLIGHKDEGFSDIITGRSSIWTWCACVERKIRGIKREY